MGGGGLAIAKNENRDGQMGFGKEVEPDSSNKIFFIIGQPIVDRFAWNRTVGERNREINKYDS